MSAAPESLPAVVVGAIAAILTTLLSKWIDSRNTDRRDAQNSRRQHDRDIEQKMDECEKEKEDLRDRLLSVRLENAALRATLITHSIEVPAFITATIL